MNLPGQIGNTCGVKHGGYYTYEYISWRSMIQRCLNPKNEAYSRYGGAGIKICDRWRSFPNFLEDMGRRPDRRYSIERINNSGGYHPSNCRWATTKEQANNRKTNRLIEHNGLILTVAQWGARLGMQGQTIAKRIDIWNWPVSRALSKIDGRRRA